MLISVVIPTKSRPSMVAGTVRSIIEGRYQQFEIFVIDQTPDDSTYHALLPFMEDHRFHYIRNRRPGYGAASSRNIGIALSSGDVIAITDDDVEAQPDWLEQIAAEFLADQDLKFIAGRLTAPPYDPSTGYTPAFDANPGTRKRSDLLLQASGANLAARVELFHQVGGCDEYCGPGSRLKASDDTDLCFRIGRSGAKWKVCPHIEVVHTHGFRSGADLDALSKRYNYGNGGNFGRFTRRGDLRAGATFLLREARQLARCLLRLLRGQRPTGIDISLLRLRGFAAGFALPPDEGFVSGDQMVRLRMMLKQQRDSLVKQNGVHEVEGVPAHSNYHG
jgi:glycosyltransferase involved in cell wall biosynthesis